MSFLKSKSKQGGAAASDSKAKETEAHLRERFGIFKTQNLKTIDAFEFASHIRAELGKVDAHAEGYSNADIGRQRDLSIKFHWGHDHDFGDFKIEGRMKSRHIKLMANFCALFSVKPSDFSGKDVFDVGCWTGGTTLLLAALGARVIATEEVKKYARMTSFLVKSFGLENKVEVRDASLYLCNKPEYYDRFDMVYFPGVIYHVSDPVLALRILLNTLRPGGKILIESEGINHEKSFCRFGGSHVHKTGTREQIDRTGWNWFLPSPSALAGMMREAGFEDVSCLWHDSTQRVFGYGIKKSQLGICRAGLSVPDIR